MAVGSGPLTDAMWGLCLGLFTVMTYLSFAGLFDLPMKLWIWWGVDAMILFLLGGAAMGWAGQRFVRT